MANVNKFRATRDRLFHFMSRNQHETCRCFPWMRLNTFDVGICMLSGSRKPKHANTKTFTLTKKVDHILELHLVTRELSIFRARKSLELKI